MKQQHEGITALKHGSITPSPALPLPATSLVVASSFTPGATGTNQPVTPGAIRAWQGSCIQTYFDVFYFNYHITPRVVDAGVITSDKSVAVSIWSAWPDSHTLDHFEYDGDSGTSVALAVPKIFKGLESVDTQYLLSANGPARLDCVVKAVFDNGQGLGKVEGLRAVLWPFRPNWAKPVDETIDANTVVFMSERGYEQRRSVWANPRRSVTFRVDTWEDMSDSLWRILDNYHDVSIAAADYVRWCNLAAPASAGDSEVTIHDPGAARRYWLTVGGYVVFRKPGEGPLQLAAVTAIDTASAAPNIVVSLDTPLAYDLSEGDYMHRCAIGYMPVSVAAGAYTYDVATVQFTLAETPGVQPAPPLISWAESFDGSPLFLRKFNWKRPPRISFRSFRRDIDLGAGRLGRYTPVPFSSRVLTAVWDEVTKEDVFEIERFFEARRGRAEAFWAPFFVRSVTPMSGLQAGQSILKVEGRDFYDAYRNSPVHPAIAVRVHGGPLVLRRVDSMSLVTDATGTNTAVVIQGTWDSDVPKDQIDGVEWLTKARFASDNLAVRWLTSEVATMTISMAQVRE